METKSYSKEIASQLSNRTSPISPAEQELFVTRLLADVNTYVQRQQDGTYEIRFHEPFVSDYPEHCKDQLWRRTVAMRPGLKADSEHVEYFALGNPVVDTLVSRVTSSSYPGSAAAYEIDASDKLRPAIGWLIVQELGVPALKELRELAPTFVHDSGDVDTALGQQLMDRATSFPNDHSLSPSEIPHDTLDSALILAETVGFDRLQELEAQARAESERQLERERAKLSKYFDYRDQSACDRLDSSEHILANLQSSDSNETRRIIPVWQANVARDERLIEELAAERVERLAQLERRAASTGDLRLVAIARVEIVGS
jgi:hypothetical protein